MCARAHVCSGVCTCVCMCVMCVCMQGTLPTVVSPCQLKKKTASQIPNVNCLAQIYNQTWCKEKQKDILKLNLKVTKLGSTQTTLNIDST